VLYLQDGQNLFDPATAFGGNEWRADITADELIRGGASSR
jgi:predicted alpha/beta superfamily hydrolase